MTQGASHNPYEAPASDVEYTGPVTESRLAGRWARFWGAMIDGIVAGLVTFPIMYFTGTLDRMMDQSISTPEMVIASALSFVLYLVLHGWLLAARGQTIGKALVRTQIVSVETEQILPVSKVFMLRFLPVAIGSNLPFIGGLISLVDVLAIFRPDRRCLHDHIAGTKVIEFRQAPS